MEETRDDSDSHDEKRRSPSAQYDDVELGAIPMGPGMTPALGPIGESPPIPPAIPELFACLRGPCRHYWETRTHVESGNPKDTWDPEIGLKDDEGNPISQPKQITRTCLAHPGTTFELTDELVYDCTRWDPLTPRELRKLDKRRRVYLKLHPEHSPRNP